MSAEATAWAKAKIAKTRLSPASKRTLLAIAKAHTKRFGVARISYDQITSVTHDCRRTAIYAVANLIEAGLIVKVGGRTGQRQGANQYRPAWPQGADTALWPECNEETSQTSALVAPSENRQGANMHHPTRARARGLGETLPVEEGIPLEEMERSVWPRLRIAGGRDA